MNKAIYSYSISISVDGFVAGLGPLVALVAMDTVGEFEPKE